MSNETAAVKQLHQTPIQQARIAGKIQHVRRANGQFFTIIVAPARDEYSHPNRFELRSKERVGQIDDVVNVMCELGGGVREFSYRDKNTGENMTGFDARHYLNVIE
jgi:hypothetical protein